VIDGQNEDEMLQAQGLQPLDPYRTLQVAPHAPRDLIDEAYWALAARANISSTAYARLRDLNDAYSLLTDDTRRERYDADNGFSRLSPLDTGRPRARKPLLPGRRRARQVYAQRHYDVLALDADASPLVVDIAHRILSRKYARGRTVDPEVIAAIDEAYRTLRNPHLRAQYDAQIPPPKRPQPRSAPVAEPPAQPQAAADAPAAPPPPVVQPPQHAPPASADVRDADMDAHNDATEASPAPVPAKPRRLFVLRPNEPAPEASTPPAPAAGDAEPEGAAHREFRPLRGVRNALRRREAARQAALAEVAEMSQEAQARLVDLRDGHEALDGAPVFPPESAGQRPVSALGEVTFAGGPYAGRVYAIGDAAFVLADLDPLVPEYGHISPYGGECMLRPAPGVETTINGEALALPLAFLDDGDEVQVGPHRFRFARPAAEEPIEFESLQSS
jgi:curved DNA-binding protein CbpA